MIPIGILARTTRAAVAEVRNQDFVQTLRAKGLSEWAVTRHVLKNAMPQVMAVMGLQFGYLLGGSILVETVFTWPGSGCGRGRLPATEVARMSRMSGPSPTTAAR
jgi:peptide/nickel transport system permease protein